MEFMTHNVKKLVQQEFNILASNCEVLKEDGCLSKDMKGGSGDIFHLELYMEQSINLNLQSHVVLNTLKIITHAIILDRCLS